MNEPRNHNFSTVEVHHGCPARLGWDLVSFTPQQNDQDYSLVYLRRAIHCMLQQCSKKFSIVQA